MAFLFLLPPLAGAAVAAALWAAGEYQIEGMPMLSPEWLAIAGIAASLLVLCVVSLTVTRKLLRKFADSTMETALFERSVTRRLAALELLPLPGQMAEPQRQSAAAPERFAETLRAAQAITAEAKPAPLPVADTGNVVQLDRSRPEKRPRQPLREIETAIAAGKHDAWYQPVVSLPDRKTRYLAGQPYLLADGEQPLAAANWFDNAVAMGKGPAIDRFMLLNGIKLWRDLNRSQKECGIIWRLSRATLADKAVWSELDEVMKANRALGKSFVCEISLADYGKLSHGELDALFAVREAGFRLGLGQCMDARALANALKTGVFSMVSADAAAIADPSGITNLRAGDMAVEFMATDVAGEDEAIALIDRDVALAQGPLFAPAKPLRRSAGGAVAPEGAA